MSSHLVNKDLTKIKNWGQTFDLWKGSNPNYKTRKPNEEEYKILKMAVIFQMTYVGAPYVYYGDEAGMWGANDPCPRKPMVWDNLEYEDEVSLPNQSAKENSDKVFFKKDMFEHYKKMISIRNSYSALQLGDYKTLLVDDENEIYAFERTLDKQSIIIVLNNGKSSKSVTLKTEHNEYFKDLLNDDMVKVKDGNITFDVDGKWGRVLLKDYYK
jgi:glycosidase